MVKSTTTETVSEVTPVIENGEKRDDIWTEHTTSEEGKKYKTQIKYHQVAFFTIIHLITLYTVVKCYVTGQWPHLYTVLWSFFVAFMSYLGVTAGAHRLYAHKCYKAKIPLQIFLVFLHCVAHQEDIIKWVRDHRLHHKHSDTDADPSNSTRGFVFSHIGWLCVIKHPDVVEKGKTIDISDVWANPILRFQKKFYYPLVILCALILPSLVPIYCWNEGVELAFCCIITRYVFNLHGTFFTNSAAHMWGNKPFSKWIYPVESHLTNFFLLGVGEGWHNYHHSFPWDYRASELGWTINASHAFIDIMAWLGLAYDLRTASDNLVKTMKTNHGDGTRAHEHHH